MRNQTIWQTMVYAHRFFTKESPRYMAGTSRLRYYLKYPKAYIRFMFYSLAIHQKYVKEVDA